VLYCAGSQWDTEVGNPAGFSLHRHATISRFTFTGAQALELRTYRVNGGSWTSTTNNATFACEVVPV